MNRLSSLCVGLALAALTASLAHSEEKPASTREQLEAERKLLDRVATALLARMDPVPGYTWPPIVRLIEDRELNAWAYAEYDDKDASAKPKPRVDVTTTWMREIVKGDADVLAYVLGHELGHIHHKHVVLMNPGQTNFERITYQRERETEADAFGAELLLKSGYSLRKALRGQFRIEAFNKRHFSRLDQLGSTHPAWIDRFRTMEKNDKLWRSMSAFAAGVSFLTTEQYSLAAECFDQVTTEFPLCHEAWANRGYAYLMLYCDGMTDRDLKEYGVGQVLCGGFYLRPKSLQPTVRGRNAKQWNEAVGSLRQALKVKPGLALVQANLALAYLFHYEGAKVETATEWIEEANAALDSDKSLDPVTRATVLVNLGAINVMGGSKAKGRKQLDEAVALVKTAGANEAGLVRGAVLYNTALDRSAATAKAERQEARKLFEQYLRTSDPFSVWWTLAHERYVELCKAVSEKPEEKEILQRAYLAMLRPTVSLDLDDKEKLTLGESIEAVEKRLGPAKETRVIGPGLRRLAFEKYGVEVLATDQVIAIVLNSAKGPVLKLRGQGAGSREAFELKVGMSAGDVRTKMPNGESYVSRELQMPEVYYHYYRHLGLAIRYDEHPRGKIKELVLVRLPDAIR